MRRSEPLKVHGIRSSDPYDNLSKEQLELIGAIAMVYNDVEATLEQMCALGLRLPIDPKEVVTRIGGIDGIAAIVKKAAIHWGMTKEEKSALSDTLGKAGFETLKGWRDSVIHARMFDVSTSVAKHHQRKAKVFDILMSKDALEGLYKRLQFLARELGWLDKVLARRVGIKNATTDQERELHEASIPTEWSRYLQNRNLRLGLPPMPEFPADTPDLARIRNLLAAQSKAGTMP